MHDFGIWYLDEFGWPIIILAGFFIGRLSKHNIGLQLIIYNILYLLIGFIALYGKYYCN